jgi:hypothetical protein
MWKPELGQPPSAFVDDDRYIAVKAQVNADKQRSWFDLSQFLC